MTTSTTTPNLLRTLLSIAFWVAMWQLGAQMVGEELLFPAPLTVLVQLGELMTVGEFWRITAYSLGRVMLGMAIGVGLGAIFAVLIFLVPLLDWILTPAVRVMRATPVVSFILLVILWTKRDLVPAVAAALMVLPVVTGNVVQGLNEVDPKLIELGHALRFSPLKRGRLIYLPSCLPYFLSAVVTSMGLSWKAGVAAEVICLPTFSIGRELADSRIYLETATLFAWTLVVILLSILLERVLSALLGRISRRWQS